MSERLSESEEDLRDSLAGALGSHVAADAARPVVHAYTAGVIAELADLVAHSRQPLDLMLRWASAEYAKAKP